MRADGVANTDAIAAWEILRGRARGYARDAWPPGPGGDARCVSCQGPSHPGSARCFQCAEHVETAPGMLADVVAPVAYARKGGRLARDLWLYKSGRPGALEAGASLLGLLLVFLADQGPRLWQRAGMAAPTHACVVPSGRGRPAPHPLKALATDYLALPWLSLQPWDQADPGVRALDPGRFRAPGPLSGARVLLLDDTWTSGASAQSAAVALKRAGAQSVVAVVLGRHLSSSRPPARQVNRL
ncbi:MAG TPA: phosphoribosyltransferase [Streptosporangiaceae bacterium]